MNSTDILMEGSRERYSERNDQLKHLCLAHFISFYEILSISNSKRSSKKKSNCKPK